MKGGYESLVWINDKDGKEFVCYLDDVANKTIEELTNEERSHCMNVNDLIGTERW